MKQQVPAASLWFSNDVFDLRLSVREKVTVQAGSMWNIPKGAQKVRSKIWSGMGQFTSTVARRGAFGLSEHATNRKTGACFWE